MQHTETEGDFRSGVCSLGGIAVCLIESLHESLQTYQVHSILTHGACLSHVHRGPEAFFSYLSEKGSRCILIALADVELHRQTSLMLNLC